MNIDKLYKNRFNEIHCNKKNRMWQVLCNFFFQKYINDDSVVVDIGAGYCEFINNIKCNEKYAIDLNQDTTSFANTDVKVLHYPPTDLSFFTDEFADVVFMSNFLEHLKTKDDIIRTFTEVFRILKSGGDVLVLQPNIRYLSKVYWDFFDHHIPLSDKSLVEALQLVGFKIKLVIPRFLPYTTKSIIPQNPWMVKFYLKCPFIWKIVGKQTFVLGRKII